MSTAISSLVAVETSGGGIPVVRRAAAPRVSNGVVGTLAYLATALMLFAGFVSAYLVLRAAAAGDWPPAGQPRLPRGVTAGSTAVLLLSGWLALRATRAGEDRSRIRFLRGAVALGTLFLAVQGLEWVRLVRYGLVMSSGLYAATFYATVGAHALHALGGLVVLALTARRLESGRGNLAASALYWGFVVCIWPVLYVVLYLV